MTITEILKRTEKLVADNSPTILTAIGVTGALTTAYLTGKATFKAAKLLDEQETILMSYEKKPPMTNRDKIDLVWKLYIPAAGVATITVFSIVGANRIGTRRAAAMAAAYSLSEKAWGEYKEKVVEKLGVQKEQQARDELAQERVDRNPVSSREVIITGGGEVLFYDDISGRYFKSTVETLRKAQNDLNESILGNMSGAASLYDFYELIGLPTTPFSTEVGWNTDNLLELNLTGTTISEDGQPCIALSYAYFPVRDYESFR